ncbi:Bug family tripartite tricarboxylate transporter substrate binding protein [Xenophilus azovorans]|uniref:Bug family tripartite tricarboxylate transporter substrate binding protein n=1 Tax=Xenophilus azovorans TaxID=151755 RepID=UPI00056F84F4|nr:tripartite tricarboxylate transporter substrate binding protein [Xenophilus azovorans]
MTALFRFLTAAVLLLAVVPAALAQAPFPGRPIHLIVAYAAGGPTDIFARLLAERMKEELGQPVVVENRPGGNTVIALQALQRAPADGYTIAIAATSMFAQPYTTKAFTFDMLSDFSPVSYLVEGPTLAFTSPQSGIRSFRELVEFARANPGKTNYGSQAAGDLTIGLLTKLSGIDVAKVPYKGSSPALQALMTNEIQLLFDSTISTKSFIDAGRIRPIGIASSRPYAALPHLEVIGKSAVPGFRTVPTWFGLIGPKGMPATIVQRLSEASRAAVVHPDLRKRLDEWGVEPLAGGPEELLATMRDSLSIYKSAAEAVGMQPQ